MQWCQNKSFKECNDAFVQSKRLAMQFWAIVQILSYSFDYLCKLQSDFTQTSSQMVTYVGTLCQLFVGWPIDHIVRSFGATHGPPSCYKERVKVRSFFSCMTWLNNNFVRRHKKPPLKINTILHFTKRNKSYSRVSNNRT